MEEYTTSVYLPVEKRFKVTRSKFRGTKYTGPTEGLAQWYYINVDPNADNITINIYGGFHETFPNPMHLSVEYESSGSTSPRYHMSVDQYGNLYAQPIAGAEKRKREKPKRKRNNKRRTRTKKR
tara:strand:+ start:39 stop:410 length:372 start_codon:yes stop_codon:yes gene_type:complete